MAVERRERKREKVNDYSGTVLLFERDVSWRNDSLEYKDDLELNKGILLLSGY